MERERTLETKVIEILRFPLIVGVVLAHAKISIFMDTSDFPIYNDILYYVNAFFFSIILPLYFAISGYLFFLSVEDFDKKTYIKKLKSRVHSLLVPYIIWNVVAIIANLAVQILFPEMLSGKKKMMIDYSITDWLCTFWDTELIRNNEGFAGPINGPLWFIRDLMILVLLSPIIYFIIKRFKKIAIIIIGCIYIFSPHNGIPGFYISSFLFFSFGAFLSINKVNFATIIKDRIALCTALYALMLPLIIYMHNVETSYTYDIIHKCTFLILSIATVSFVSHFTSNGAIRQIPLLSSSSVLIFFYHLFPLALLTKVSLKVLPTLNDWTLLFCQISCTFAIVLIGIATYKLLDKYAPRFKRIILGGR